MGMSSSELAEIRLKVMGLSDLLDDLGKAKDGAGQLADGLNRSVGPSSTLASNLKDMGVTMKSVAMSALESYGNLEKLAGVKGVGERIKDWEGWEEKIIDIKASIGATKAELDKLIGTRGGKLFDIAKGSGFNPETIADALVSLQNETSKGEDFMANGGALMLESARFAKAAKGDPKDMAIAMAKNVAQWSIGSEDARKIPGSLMMQQQQGSLEAKTMGKFEKNIAPYRALTGESGIAGMLAFYAQNNILKDRGGTGSGQQGAATAAVLQGALIQTLSDPKKLKGLEKALGGSVRVNGRVSMDALMARLRAAGGNEDKELLDKAAKGDDGAASKLQKESQFFRKLAGSVGNSQARRAITALFASEKLDHGTSKDIKKLRAPDWRQGAALINTIMEGTGEDDPGYLTIRKGVNQSRETQNLRDVVRTYRKSAGVEIMDAAGAKANSTISNNPNLSIASDALSVGGVKPVQMAMTAFNAASLAGKAVGDYVQQAPVVNVTNVVTVAADGQSARIVSEQRSVAGNANPAPRPTQKGVR